QCRGGLALGRGDQIDGAHLVVLAPAVPVGEFVHPLIEGGLVEAGLGGEKGGCAKCGGAKTGGDRGQVYRLVWRCEWSCGVCTRACNAETRLRVCESSEKLRADTSVDVAGTSACSTKPCGPASSRRVYCVRVRFSLRYSRGSDGGDCRWSL